MRRAKSNDYQALDVFNQPVMISPGMKELKTL